MTDLDVRAGGDHVYDVAITADDGAVRRYRVSVPESLAGDVGAADEPTVVRRALELLVQGPGRSGPPESLPPEFSLAQVEDHYPGFNDQLSSALQPR